MIIPLEDFRGVLSRRGDEALSGERFLSFIGSVVGALVILLVYGLIKRKAR